MAVGRRAVFLDRDGVLVVPEFRGGRSYAPRAIQQFQVYPEAGAALNRLKRAGYVLIVVTNQPDVGHGYITRELMDEMHRRLAAELPIDAIKACYHTQNQACACRKPRPGMLLDSAGEYGISLADSFMVGDRVSDVEAGHAAGCRTIFIDLGYTSEPRPDNATFTVRSISEAAKVILFNT